MDVVDDPVLPDGALRTRWINIMTAREDRFSPAGVDEDPRSIDLIFTSFDAMHTELKTMLASIISESMATRIYLMKG